MADVMYKINGTGRDLYIYQNNGGFSIYNDRPIANKPGGFLPKINRSPCKFPDISQPMAKRYQVDGTGRDLYIYTDNGGNTISGQSFVRDSRAIFAGSLRKYERNDEYLAGVARRKGIDLKTFFNSSPERLHNLRTK